MLQDYESRSYTALCSFHGLSPCFHFSCPRNSLPYPSQCLILFGRTGVSRREVQTSPEDEPQRGNVSRPLHWTRLNITQHLAKIITPCGPLSCTAQVIRSDVCGRTAQQSRNYNNNSWGIECTFYAITSSSWKFLFRYFSPARSPCWGCPDHYSALCDAPYQESVQMAPSLNCLGCIAPLFESHSREAWDRSCNRNCFFFLLFSYSGLPRDSWATINRPNSWKEGKIKDRDRQADDVKQCSEARKLTKR